MELDWVDCTSKTQIFVKKRDNIFKVNSLAKHLLCIYRQYNSDVNVQLLL